MSRTKLSIGVQQPLWKEIQVLLGSTRKPIVLNVGLASCEGGYKVTGIGRIRQGLWVLGSDL